VTASLYDIAGFRIELPPHNLICYGTVNVVLPVIFVTKSVAVMLVVPDATALARPIVPDVLLIVATPGLDELQKTNVVTSSMVPGVNISVAVNC
jgi:hypothetical protein